MSDLNNSTSAPTTAGGPSRRRVLAGGLGGAAALTLAGGTLPASAHTPTPSQAGAGSATFTAASRAAKSPFPGQTTGFVTVKGGAFHVHGEKLYFGGTNNYYLHEQSHYMIDSVLNDAAAMSLAVVRAWAFMDGAEHNGRSLHPKPYVYNDADFDSLDYAVYKAGTLGLRLVLPLVNNWPDYGGMAQYVTWFLGLPDDSYGDGVNHDRFYTDTKIRQCYRAYARHVINRVNPYTGLRYNQDPTIMTFELANEPRCRSDKSGDTLHAWVAEMSAFVKAQAPRQLVAVGDEGFFGTAGEADYPYSDYEGADFARLTSVSTVDYGTYHLYPQGWGENPQSKPGTDPVVWGTEWIKRHIAKGRTLGKPVVLEEYGLAIDAARGVADVAARDAGYTAWTSTVEKSGGAGDQFWILTALTDDGTLYGDYDGYRVTYPSSTATLLKAHAQRMAAKH